MADVPAPTQTPLVIVATKLPTLRRRALLFTMDSTSQYEQNAAHGGASGEITIRRSLFEGLRSLGCDLVIAKSDADFVRLCPERGDMCDAFAFLVLDAWTWAAPGWKAKPNLVGREHKLFLLDYFGASGPRNNGINVPISRILTAFPTFPGNTFLGFFYDAAPNVHAETKQNIGVVWGKDPRHYKGKARLLRTVASLAALHSTLDKPTPELHAALNITYHGHLSKNEWSNLLAKAKFVLGLGDPLLGPSALDAVAHGCVYVDPYYPTIVKSVYTSQHPYLRSVVGSPYVCAAHLDNIESYVRCVHTALRQAPLPPFVPQDFTRSAYLKRIKSIFGTFLEVSTVGRLSSESPA